MFSIFRGYLFLFIFVLVSIRLSAQISNDFNGNAQGWTTPNDADGTIGYSTTGGNPGGFVFGSPFIINLGPSTIYVPYQFVGTGSYTGNRSDYYGGTISYDVQLSTSGTPNVLAEAIITNGGTTLYYYPATPYQPPSAPAWTRFSVTLNNSEGFWKTTDSQTGPIASEAQILAVLTSLSGLQIRGLYRDANVITRLDNVAMTEPVIITTQPTSATVCNGATATFTVSANNNPNITYQWQHESTPGTWITVTNGGGYSGATTTTLSVNTSGNFGSGNYRALISGTNTADLPTSPATLTINALPNPPTTTGSSSCSAASLTLSASGGTAGQYRWYTVPTGGTALAGQTNSTYTTPVLTSTTIYYVAINNGCQSTRTPVTGTIATPPDAPATIGNSSCAAASVTLTASGGTAGQYRWYNVPTGGTALAGEVNSTYTTPVLASTTTYYVAIHNGTCESTRTPVIATIATPGCDNHPPTIETASVSTQIGGTISILLTDLISDADNNVDLLTLSIILPPASGAAAVIDNTQTLIIDYTGIEFSGIESITIQVCDLYAACAQQILSITVVGEIEIYNALSPNNDGLNEILFIEHIETLEDTRNNHVTIFNRWGDPVFDVTNYNNTDHVFTGKSNDGHELPSGTYFYKIEFSGNHKTETGYLSIKR